MGVAALLPPLPHKGARPHENARKLEVAVDQNIHRARGGDHVAVLLNQRGVRRNRPEVKQDRNLRQTNIYFVRLLVTRSEPALNRVRDGNDVGDRPHQQDYEFHSAFRVRTWTAVT